MNQSPSPHVPKPPRVPMIPGMGQIPDSEPRMAAKWPPDDDNLPPGPVGPSFDDMGDGNFKRGRFKVAGIIIAILVVIGGAGLLVFGLKADSEKLTPKQISEEKKNLALLSMAESLPKWRAWAANEGEPKLREEAFAQLAWAKDQEGLALIIKGLSASDHRVRGTAAQALLEYGTPAADSARPALLKALAESEAGDKPQIAWALAALHEPAAFDQVMIEYRAGHLAKVQRLDGSPAFDPEHLAAMVSLDKLATLAGDESESVRQLVATVLSRAADPKYTDTLVKLVTDKEIEVGREAAVGLGKIANDKAMGPLLDALGRADKDSRQKFLEALRDGVGGKGLVLALKSVQKDKYETEKHQTKLIFDMLRGLEDPRAGDALLAYIQSNPHPHWKTEAALRMAEVGDLRAVPTLAWRMKQDPLKLYDENKDPEWGKLDTDSERVVAARMLADLAVLYPDKRGEIREQAYEAVMFWLTDKPQPHANGLRFIAASESKEGLPKLRGWAAPKIPLPREGEQKFPQDWVTAQSALRYLGWMQDQQSWPLLELQFNRKPAKVDTTMEVLQQGGLAVLGMTLRALAVGAAHGFAQWGDPRAYPTLVKFIEDKTNNEQARVEACFALAWSATDEQMKEVAKKVREFDKPDPKNQLIHACYLETLIRRPVPEATAGLVDMLRGDKDLAVTHQVARAIGFGGLTPDVSTKLFEKLKDAQTRNDAMLALMIGADADTVRRAMATYNDVDKAATEELKRTYENTFGYWSDKNFESGELARWIDNAVACGRVRVYDALQDWPRLILSRSLQQIDFDNGPRSITRVQLRTRLLRDARGTDEVKRQQAIRMLKFLNERGSLMALKSEDGPAKELARQAFFEIMNPKVVLDTLPEQKKQDDPAKGGGVKVVP